MPDGSGVSESVADRVRGGLPSPAQVRALFRGELLAVAQEWEDAGAVPREVFARLGAAGVFRARWDRESAPGLGDLEIGATIVRESAIVSPGGGVAIGAHIDPYLTCLRDCEYGGRALALALDGGLVGAVGISEPAGGSNPGACSTTAKRVRGGWEITGVKQYVSNLVTAHDCVVLARTGPEALHGLSLFVVPVHDGIVDQEPHAMSGSRASGTARATFRGVGVGDDRLVGELGTGLRRVAKMLEVERMWAAVGGATLAELSLELALAFATARRPYGKALRRHQAIAHRLAEMSIEVEAARVLAESQLQAAEAGRLNPMSVAKAKVFTAGVASRVSDAAVQIMGACGYTEETCMSRVWRDVRVGRIGGGTDEVLKELISRGLTGGPLKDLPAVREVRRQAGRA